MAKQSGDFLIEGTIDDLTFYKMLGDYYVGMKSSLTSKRFRKDKAFEGSRKSSSRFGEGNRLASKVYQMVEEEKRVYKLFCFLKRRAIYLLKDGWSVMEVEEVLIDYLVQFGVIKVERKSVARENYSVIPILEAERFAGDVIRMRSVNFLLDGSCMLPFDFAQGKLRVRSLLSEC